MRKRARCKRDKPERLCSPVKTPDVHVSPHPQDPRLNLGIKAGDEHRTRSPPLPGSTAAKMAPGLRLALLFCLTSGLFVSGSWSASVCSRTGCPSGWTRYGRRCYFVFSSPQTTADAERICISRGGNLVSIHNLREHNFVRSLIYQRFRRYVTAWIGLYDALQEGKWLWTDGSRLVFTRWGNREPNNNYGRGRDRTEHCTEINWGGSYWNDFPCRFKKPFVCARKV